jgi:hypothetical protein
VLATAVWSVADRRRPHYRRFAQLLWIYARYALAASMLPYGAWKLWKTQFPSPDPLRLLEPYGQSSPMGLAWTFLGYSTAYNVFIGLGEAGGAMLLLWRRTTTLGALMLAVVLANVVMINFCYDVPVKLMSSHLLLMSLYLALPDGKRLLDVLVWNRATTPTPPRPALPRRWMEHARRVVKVLFVGWLVYQNVHDAREQWRSLASPERQPTLHGLWAVDVYRRDGVEQPPLLTDSKRWRRLMVTEYGVAAIYNMNDQPAYARFAEHLSRHDVTLSSMGQPVTTLSFTRPDPDHLELRGEVRGARIEVQLHRVDPSQSLLVSRGFHWINEFPLNR